MANYNEQVGGLEDQLRRMILSNGPENAAQPAPPTARLPPSAPGQYSRPPLKHNTPPSTQQVAQSYGNPKTIGKHQPQAPISGNRQPFPPHRQNQGQRRSQPQMQFGPPNDKLNGNHSGMHRQVPHRQPQYPQPQMDPNAFQRGEQVVGYHQRPPAPPRQLFDPRSMQGPRTNLQADQHIRQAQYLDRVASVEVTKVTMSSAERDKKEAFRMQLEVVVHEVCNANPDRMPKVSLESFGSFKSGFANAGSDMDLVIVLPDGSPYTPDLGLLEDDLPRALEKRLLQLGYGARLLTRTRVPIIKICEKPNDCLLDKLREEREKWDEIPHKKKYPHLYVDDGAVDEEFVGVTANGTEPKPNVTTPAALPATEMNESPQHSSRDTANSPVQRSVTSVDTQTADNTRAVSAQQAAGGQNQPPRPRRDDRPFTRERKMGPLDFPKEGVGIQSDINFFNPLGLHNTQLLRCYSLCDPRVKPMVLFVKSWAKRRKINSSYSGTLSSYGYVLMVLHYLVNVARPPVLPNLQSSWRPNGESTPPGATRVECDGWVVDFWRNEDEIMTAVETGQMASNRESLGSLLEGFFRYYSSMGSGPQFHWMQQVLSLRSPGGIISKEEKGWVKAITEEGEGKKVQHRYLFCIEDPFELSHNVARTVTHHGIVAIRDEFRHARRILLAVVYGQPLIEGELFDELVEEKIEEAMVNPMVAGHSQMNGAAAIPNGAQPTSNGMVQSSMVQNKARWKQNKRAQTNGATSSSAPPKSLNVTDNDAFPSLGPAKPKLPPAKSKQPEAGEMSEISGDRAKAYLEDLKRKKAEADAEMTATGAAEAVLGDD